MTFFQMIYSKMTLPRKYPISLTGLKSNVEPGPRFEPNGGYGTYFQRYPVFWFGIVGMITDLGLAQSLAWPMLLPAHPRTAHRCQPRVRQMFLNRERDIGLVQSRVAAVLATAPKVQYAIPQAPRKPIAIPRRNPGKRFSQHGNDLRRVGRVGLHCIKCRSMVSCPHKRHMIAERVLPVTSNWSMSLAVQTVLAISSFTTRPG